MTIDTTELKRAAEACDVTKCADEAEWDRRFSEFLSECDPDVTLALLAEIERLEAEVKRMTSIAYAAHGAFRMETLAERDQLKAENDALRKDAERYRWIRTADWWRSPVCAISNPKEQAKLGSDCPSGERLDAQIDAAMAKEASHG